MDEQRNIRFRRVDRNTYEIQLKGRPVGRIDAMADDTWRVKLNGTPTARRFATLADAKRVILRARIVKG